ncbi:uncharacterized protein Hap1MRO34_014047 [Clarias gariepinus]
MVGRSKVTESLWQQVVQMKPKGMTLSAITRQVELIATETPDQTADHLQRRADDRQKYWLLKYWSRVRSGSELTAHFIGSTQVGVVRPLGGHCGPALGVAHARHSASGKSCCIVKMGKVIKSLTQEVQLLKAANEKQEKKMKKLRKRLKALSTQMTIQETEKVKEGPKRNRGIVVAFCFGLLLVLGRLNYILKENF